LRIQGVDLDEILERARAFCSYPRIMDPEFVLNPAGHPHAAKLNDEFGMWEPSENRVYINVPEVMEKLGIQNLEAVVVYQLLHYALAPFDMRTSLRLTASAKMALEEVKDRGRMVNFQEAMSIQRLFCDIVNVTYAARGGMREQMIGLYHALDKAKGWKQSKMWKFLLCCFEELWEAPGALIGRVPKEMRDDARRLAARVLDRPFAAAGWEEKVRFLVGYLHRYYEDPEEMDDSRIMDHGIDDLRSRSPEEALRSMAMEMGMQDFKELVGGIGAARPRPWCGTTATSPAATRFASSPCAARRARRCRMPPWPGGWPTPSSAWTSPIPSTPAARPSPPSPPSSGRRCRWRWCRGARRPRT